MEVEARFAALKRYVGLRQPRPWWLAQAAEQFLLAATAQNLTRLAALPHPPWSAAPAVLRARACLRRPPLVASWWIRSGVDRGA